MAIHSIDIVMHTHTDFGYTDYPLSARKFLAEYVSHAIHWSEVYRDFPEKAQFRWTLETLMPVYEWWQEASEEDRARLLTAIDHGQIEVSGLPFNITAFLDDNQWDYLLRWIPRELWDRMNIQSAMQVDINGLHTGGLSKAYDAGIRNIWIGANTYNGSPPVPTPAMTHWQLDDQRQMRVWINPSYCDGYFLFHENWRQGPVPNACDLRYRKPGPRDFFRADEESIREAHAACLRNIAAIEGVSGSTENSTRDGFTQNKVFGGYTGSVLAVSITNQWRVDNDPPCWWICDFVKKWNEIGLQPELRLRTMTQAMDEISASMLQKPCVLTGEWTDWWANGDASSPSELSYNRNAKRLLWAAKSPLFGNWTESDQALEDKSLFNLSMYDEHSFGAWQSVAHPDSFENRSQRAEKNIFAYRGLNLARELFHKRSCILDTDSLRNAIRIGNPTTIDRTYEITLPRNCLRGDYTHLINQSDSSKIPIHYISGIANFLRPNRAEDFGDENISRTFCDSVPEQTAVFSVRIPALSSVDFLLRTGECPDKIVFPDCQIETDYSGWPVSVVLNEKLLLGNVTGQLHVLHADGFSPRWTFRDIFDTEDPIKRNALYQSNVHLQDAQYGQTNSTRQGNLIRFTQSLSHPSLAFGKRILTIDTDNATVSLTVRFYRNANLNPEIYYIAIESPVQNGEVFVSNAGKPFRPGLDQIAGSCRDYYAIDGWVLHQNRNNSWLVYSRDAALVAFERPTQPSRRLDDPTACHKMFYQIFDNTWDTNFNANAFGLMEFTFDITNDVALNDCNRISQELAAEPVVIVRTGYDS